MRPEGTIGLHSVCPSVSPSVTLFPDFFLTVLSHIWIKVGSKLLYEELQIKFDFCHGWPTFSCVIAVCSKFCPSHQFSGLFLFMLSRIRMKVDRQFLYEQLFFHISGWQSVASFFMKSYRSSSSFVKVDQLFSYVIAFISKLCPSHQFSRLVLAMLSQSEWQLVASFYIKSYRSSSTFVLDHLLFPELAAELILLGSWGTCIALAILTVCLLFVIMVIPHTKEANVSYRYRKFWISTL